MNKITIIYNPKDLLQLSPSEDVEEGELYLMPSREEINRDCNAEGITFLEYVEKYPEKFVILKGLKDDNINDDTTPGEDAAGRDES